MFIHVFYVYGNFSAGFVHMRFEVWQDSLKPQTEQRSLLTCQTPADEPTKQPGSVEFVTPNWP